MELCFRNDNLASKLTLLELSCETKLFRMESCKCPQGFRQQGRAVVELFGADGLQSSSCFGQSIGIGISTPTRWSKARRSNRHYRTQHLQRMSRSRRFLYRLIPMLTDGGQLGLLFARPARHKMRRQLVSRHCILYHDRLGPSGTRFAFLDISRAQDAIGGQNGSHWGFPYGSCVSDDIW